jgi:hypothetical protein
VAFLDQLKMPFERLVASNLGSCLHLVWTRFDATCYPFYTRSFRRLEMLAVTSIRVLGLCRELEASGR